MYSGGKPLRHSRPAGAGRESAVETAALIDTESPVVTRWVVCVKGASIARLSALGESHSARAGQDLRCSMRGLLVHNGLCTHDRPVDCEVRGSHEASLPKDR